VTTYEQAIPAAIGAGASTDEKRRTAITGAFLAEFIDMFDIYLPVVVLAPVLAYFQPAQVDPAWAAILNSFVYITTLLGRPIGALIFGRLADRIGRRRSTIYSVAGFGVLTLLIGLLPGYQSIGIASYLLLVTLRFLDGVCLGGGYTAAHPLAMEYSLKSKRGFVGGLILAAFPGAYVAISAVAMVTLAVVPLAGMDSPYAVWGWRIPFVIGAALAGVLVLYYERKVSESELWQARTAGAGKAPATRLFGGSNAVRLMQVLVMMTGFWTTQNLITLFMPSVLLRQILHLTEFQITTTLIITYCVLFFSYIGAGMLGQRIGRRLTFIILGCLIASVGVGLFWMLANQAAGLPLPMIILLVCVLAILVTAPWGVIITYINERFATDVRGTAFGIGFSLSVVLPSFYAVYVNWLGKLVPLASAPAALMFIGAVIATFGAAIGPETRDVDM